MNFSPESKFLIGLGVAFVLLILTIVGEQRTAAQLQYYRQWVTHTHDVIELLQSTLLSIDAAAMSRRASLVTGSKLDLNSYQTALALVTSHIQQIKNLTADNAREQQRVDLLERLVSARFVYLQEMAGRLAGRGASAAQAAPIFQADGAAAARIVQCVDEMEVEERALLNMRLAGARKVVRRTRDFGTFGSIMAIALLAAAAAFLYRDSSARRRAARTIAEQAKLLDLTQDAIFLRSQNGQILFWNLGAERLYGWTREEALASNSRTLLRTLFPLAPAEIEAELLRSGFWEGELIHTKKDGNRVTVASRWALRSEGPGKPPSVLELNTDITKQKQAVEELAEKTKDLERSNGELAQFAYVASHDLQEPLRMVSSYVQLLGRRYKGQLGAEADEYIHFAVDGVVRMQSLIQDLLAYSRVSTKGKVSEVTNAREPLERALANLQGAIKESGASVRYNGLPTLPCDASQMVQLFQNLVGNAIKYCGERPPQVSVDAKPDSNEWIFSVQDNGIGIDPEYYERIFTIFQRLHNRAEYPGTGIGLAICKKIVERHGGRIWVESQPGSGSTFYFTMAKT
jgi:PAS domain S-box-containing protein